MTQLTGKTKTDFIFWLIEYFKTERPDYVVYSEGSILRKFDRKTKIEQNALICKWLDLLRIQGKSLFIVSFDFWYKQKTEFQDFEEIISVVIDHCNKLYNELKP